MAKEISINFTEDELEVLNSILVNLQLLPRTGINDKSQSLEETEVNIFIENLLIKIAKAKFEHNIVNKMPKI